MPNPKEQLELLAAHQEEFAAFLNEVTGLHVKVSLAVHPTNNSKADLLNLFNASLTMPDFLAQSTPEWAWIAHKNLNRSISVFMPDGFDTADLYPELDDDEGYAQAVEVKNLRIDYPTGVGDETPF